jgi:parvulin-like peptidyl-prolyl isomerase
MIKIIQKLLKEPLIHFFIVGLILYIYYAQTQTQTTSASSLKTPIQISSYEIDEIKSNYKKLWHRDIDDVELQAFIEQKFHNKALLNEAYLLNLQKQDEVISKRLLKKMHFILLNSAKITEPSEEELELYYKKHIVDYSDISSLSFAQVFFSSSTDKEKVNAILKLLDSTNVDAQKASSFGESSSVASQLDGVTFQQAKEMFGNYFASKLFKLKSKQWFGVFHSKMGLHIVYIKDKNVTQPYPFDEVQGRVYEDFMSDLKRSIEQNASKRVFSTYKLEMK